MRQAVKDVFFDFTAGREGYTPFMYADTLNLVTTGVGNLIDSGPRNSTEYNDTIMAPAFNLPWKHRGAGWTSKNPVVTDAASHDEIRDAWITVKTQEAKQPGFSQKGGFAYAGLTTISLSIDDIKNLFNQTMNADETELRKFFPNWDSFPADAQLGIMSMAWAMGAGFPQTFVTFTKAANAGDWRTTAEQSYFKGGGGTYVAGNPSTRSGRNAENYEMFTNAANVVSSGSDPNVIYFVTGKGVPPTQVATASKKKVC